MSAKQEQEIYLKFYNYAMDAIRDGNYEVARKALICAISTLMRIREIVDKELKVIYYNKILNLIEKCSNIRQSSFEELFDTVSNFSLGLNVGIDEDEIDSELLKGNNSECKKALDDVAGLKEIKDEINNSIVNRYKYPDIYNKFRKKTGGGILLYGLPGTGKTMVARAIAKDINAKFISVKCSDLMTKFFGESEKNIRKIFEDARKNPCSVIFFDEFDALGAKRKDDNDGTMDRFVAELLTQIQGIEEYENNLVLIAATNKPWNIDSAFLRPGRFGKKIYVPLPDGEARRQIITVSLRGAPTEDKLFNDKLLNDLEGYSGADINELCERAKMRAIEREINSGKPTVIGIKDITDALGEIKSSINALELKMMNQFKDAN